MSNSNSATLSRNEICDALRSDLISGRLGFDQPVREQKLAQRFGTSRGPVRDALLRLTQEGALVYEANKGVRVTSPLNDEERSVVANLRLTLEKHCLGKFIEKMNAKDEKEYTAVAHAEANDHFSLMDRLIALGGRGHGLQAAMAGGSAGSDDAAKAALEKKMRDNMGSVSVSAGTLKASALGRLGKWQMSRGGDH